MGLSCNLKRNPYFCVHHNSLLDFFTRSEIGQIKKKFGRNPKCDRDRFEKELKKIEKELKKRKKSE